MRGITLEIPNLTDPTEGRYALTALDMVSDGNYLVPQILRGDSREPYLGKPPLFFWSTAAAVVLFGTEEWSVRLPGYFSFLLVGMVLFFLAAVRGNLLLGLNAALIWVSSLLPFFLSGTVSMDPMLTFFVSVLMVLAYCLLHEDQLIFFREWPRGFLRKALVWRLFFWFLAGLSILVKGPVIALYLGLPIFVYTLLTRTVKNSIHKLGLFYGPLISAIFFLPWFLAAEYSNPGFIKYFLFSENFKRFLVRDYGDKYGSGHQYPYGTALVFLFIGAFPWSLSALGAISKLTKSNLNNLKKRFWSDSLFIFAASWAFCAPIVLVLAHQLHPGYVLPALPGFSVLLVVVLGSERLASFARGLTWVLLPVILAIAFYGAVKDLLGHNIWIMLGMGLSLAAAIVASRAKRFASAGIAQTACCIVMLYCAVLFGSNNFVNHKNSTKQILLCISKTLLPANSHKIALIEVKQYAAYFYSDSWKTQLEIPLQIDYVDSEQLPTALPPQIIVKASKIKELQLDPQYRVIAKIGPLAWLSAETALDSSAVHCN